MEYLWKLNTKDKYFPALNGHKFSRTGREMFSDMTNDDYREEIKRSIEQIKDPNMGICVEADLRVTAAGDLKHEFRYTLPKTPIGHRTFWWWEGWFENYKPTLRIRYVNVSYTILSKLKYGQKLSTSEAGVVANMPLNLINSSCYFVGIMKGKWGRAPLIISRVRPETAWLGAMIPVLLRNLCFGDSVLSYVRSHANPAGSLPAFQRNAKKSDACVTLEQIAESFEDVSNLSGWRYPKFGKGWTIDILLRNATINPDKSSGSVGIMGFGGGFKKKNFLHCVYHSATLLAEYFKKKNKKYIFDTSLYQSGGRAKKASLTEGKALQSRPVWMASATSEVLTDTLNWMLLRIFGSMPPPHPLYLGKNLDKNRWRLFVNYIGIPQRSCAHVDFSKYDSTVPQALIDWSFGLLRSFLPSGKVWDKYIVYIWSGFTTHPIVLPGGETYVFDRGVPSGHKFTSLINTLACYSIMCFWQYNTPGYDDYKAKVIAGKCLPMISCHLGDDTGLVSTSELTDEFCKRCAESWKTLLRKYFDMDIDEPYIGPFAVENPESEGFEFLRTRFWCSADSNARGELRMNPTIAGKELVNRLCIPEYAGHRRLSQRRQAVLEGAACAHPLGTETWASCYLWHKLAQYDFSISFKRTGTHFLLEEGYLHYEQTWENAFCKEQKQWFNRWGEKIKLSTYIEDYKDFYDTEAYRERFHRFLYGTFGPYSYNFYDKEKVFHFSKLVHKRSAPLIDRSAIGDELSLFSYPQLHLGRFST